MTATPIPRTLAMAAYADLDTSVIDELPPGRTPVKTVVISDSRRDDVVDRVRKALRERPAGLLGLSADRGVRTARCRGGGGALPNRCSARCPASGLASFTAA